MDLQWAVQVRQGEDATSLVAELRALQQGLQWACDMGFEQLEVESDSQMGVRLVQNASEENSVVFS